MIKQGFGRVSEELYSLYVLSIPNPSPRYNIIQLPPKKDKRIFNLSVSWNVVLNGFPAGAPAGLFGGRVLIVGGEYENVENEDILPDKSILPKSLDGMNVYFDQFIGGGKTTDNTAARKGVQDIRENFFFGGNGILIPDGTPCSIIQTYAMTADSVIAGSDNYSTAYPANSILCVNGVTDGQDKIFDFRFTK